MAIQIYSSAAEVVSFPVRRTWSNLPPSLSPKQHTSSRHASCCHSEQAWKANHFLPRNKVQLHRAFAVIPLLLVSGERYKKKKKGHRWQRYNITAKAGECGTILGLPGFMWSLHCKLKNKTKKLEIIINKKERKIRSASTSIRWWWMLMQWLWNWQKSKPKIWVSYSTWQAKATF